MVEIPLRDEAEELEIQTGANVSFQSKLEKQPVKNFVYRERSSTLETACQSQEEFRDNV